MPCVVRPASTMRAGRMFGALVFESFESRGFALGCCGWSSPTRPDEQPRRGARERHFGKTSFRRNDLGDHLTSESNEMYPKSYIPTRAEVFSSPAVGRTQGQR